MSISLSKSKAKTIMQFCRKCFFKNNMQKEEIRAWDSIYPLPFNGPEVNDETANVNHFN